jgi:hypothetical protein
MTSRKALALDLLTIAICAALIGFALGFKAALL